MDTPHISKPVLRFFRRIVRGYFRQHFHAVRIKGAAQFSAARNLNEPLILYANHGSWWDPMVSFLLAEKLMPKQQHFAPMEAQALKRYGILKHVGIFPVELNTGRGAVQFLRTSEAIARTGGVVWITPQGKFVDPRVRPLEFKPGLAALAVRIATNVDPCTVQPLAIEYTFWDERLPECLLHLGEPVLVLAGETTEDVESRLILALEDSMDTLQELALRRDASMFETIAQGTVGAGGFYALGQRIKAILTRRPYTPQHTLPPAVREVPK
jgi:1-acyl-sn-glycerol-3-phosphate acyltransferase